MVKELTLNIPTSYSGITLKKWLELQKELETKGLMKNGKKQIPEEMLRSIMRDALTLSEGK